MSCSLRLVAPCTRCHSSFRNSTTYTPCATISPRYSGNCSQREEKISAGSGLRREFESDIVLGIARRDAALQRVFAAPSTFRCLVSAGRDADLTALSAG